MAESSPEVDAIEAFFQRRYGRDAMYLPSGRLALYLAFREWLSSGARILMSPVTDDVVFFTVLAAGLRPVLGPLDPRTGNLDPARIEDTTWSSLSAVLTTNLYGIPDRMGVLEERCRRYGLVLLEDAAHALDSRVEDRRIGTFGTAAVFSLAKHLEIPGGVLAFPDGARRESLLERAERELRPRPPPSVAAHRWLALAKAIAGRPRVPRALARMVVAVVPRDPRGGAHRMPFTEEAVRGAQDQGGGLDPFESWVRMDHPAYRSPPLRPVLRRSLRRLETFEQNRRRRLEGTSRLLGLGLTPRDIEVPRDTALLRVPLFVEGREQVLARLSHWGLTTEYVYDPPLDLYAPTLSESLPSPPGARLWSRDVLPVNPLDADRFLAIWRDATSLFRPLRAA
jgi:DegT/DnrJ/EryC1/StrS aminotransferase family